MINYESKSERFGGLGENTTTKYNMQILFKTDLMGSMNVFSILFIYLFAFESVIFSNQLNQQENDITFL